MAQHDESRVRSLAQQLWEEDGRQAGRDIHYWHVAEQRLREQDDQANFAGQEEAVTPSIPLPLPLK